MVSDEEKAPGEASGGDLEDDEPTNTKIHHSAKSRCHLLFCWAHE